VLNHWQAQGGKRPPTSPAVVFIFKGDKGAQYEYQDGWTEDGVFIYTGESKRGNVDFVREIRALSEHRRRGKETHLNEDLDQGIVRYQGQMVYIGFERREAPDINGNFRSAILLATSAGSFR